MLNINKYVAIFALCFALSGCSFGGDEAPNLSEQAFDVSMNNVYDDALASRTFSDGRVEVFDFDAPVQPSIQPSTQPYGSRLTAPIIARSSNFDDLTPISISSETAPMNDGWVDVQPSMNTKKSRRHEPATIYFSHDSVGVNSHGRDIVRDIAKFNTSAKSGGQIVRYDIEGHASTRSSLKDPIQRQIINLKISMDRAFNVARSMILGGVPAETIKVSAFGETRPVESHTGQSTDEAARRVEIYPENLK